MNDGDGGDDKSGGELGDGGGVAGCEAGVFVVARGGSF